MDRLDIVDALREIAQRLTMQGGDSGFRARAYERGAAAIASFEGDLAGLAARGELKSIPNIGAGLAATIEEMLRDGRSTTLDRLRHEMPAIVVAIAERANVSPARAKRIHEVLGIETIEQLRDACRGGRVREIHGIGPATEKRMLDAIERADERRGSMLLYDARVLGASMIARLEPVATRVELAGETRRWQEVVSAVDLVVESNAPTRVLDRVADDPRVVGEVQRSDATVSVRHATGAKVRVHAVKPRAFVSTLMRETGTTSHLERLDAIAADSGFTWRSDGTLIDAFGNAVPLHEEHDFYAALGLAFVPPELREGPGELVHPRANDDPFADLVDTGDIRGLVHCHTTFSDGRHTVEEMARAADAMGIEYLTITDHSPTANYAGGVTLERLKAQWDEIDRVQELVRVRLLRGTESDILADGSLDYPDRVLERFDVVIASVHARMKMNADEMTRRITTAMRLPVFKIWGHALGRRLLDRPPFECRVEEILDVIAESEAAIEVNGDPHRLDMEPRWIREARKRKIRFVISSDAHSTGAFANLPYGVAMARRGGLRRSEVLNTRGVEAFRRAVRPAGR